MDQAKIRSGGKELVRSLLAGAVSGSICFAITVALAAAVFSGPLKPAFSDGLSMILFGGIVFAIAGVVFGRSFGAQYQTQSATGVIAAIAVGRIADALPDASVDVLLWSAIAFIVLSTALSGIVLVLAGTARLGHAARFIPYPVLGGFVAATGLFLIARAFLIMAPSASDLSSSFATLESWGPPIALGMFLVLVERLTQLRYLILWGVGAVALFAHLGAFFLEGELLEGLRFLDAVVLGAAVPDPFVWDQLATADFETVFAQFPLALALAGLALVAALVNVSAWELSGQHSLDLNHEMIRAGSANLLGSLGGGLTGFQSLSLIRISQSAGGSVGSVLSVAATLTFILAALLAPLFLSVVPVAAMSLVLAYIGAGMLYDWLWVERKRLSAEENAVVLVIVAVSALFGLVVALGVGIVVASMLFAVSYSRLNVVWAEYSGSLARSATERSAREDKLLTRFGRQTSVIELQGFLFFGTANTIVERIKGSVIGNGTRVRTLVLDFQRVQAIDASAVSSMQKLHLLARQQNMDLHLTGMRDSVRKGMVWCEQEPDVRTFPTLEACLSWTEDEILRVSDLTGGGAETSDLAAIIEEIKKAGYDDLLPQRSLKEGETLFSSGTPADCLAVLESGRLSAIISAGPNGATKVASFLEGAVVGELGYYGEMPRTANVIAENASVVRVIPRDTIELLEREEAELATRLHALLACVMASRLARTTALLNAMGN